MEMQRTKNSQDTFQEPGQGKRPWYMRYSDVLYIKL